MQSDFPASKLDLNALTHVIHAFGWPDKEGNVLSYSNMFNSGISKVIHAKNRKFLLGLGGWGNDEGFPIVAASADLRKKFINNLIKVCEDNGYDGVDLDWEFPKSSADRSNLNLLVSEMDSMFYAYDQDWLITMAVPVSNWSGQWHDFYNLKNHIDFFNAMTYDTHGSWSDHVGHNSPLFQSPSNDPDGSCETGINYLVQFRGIPREQINMGLPFWGKQYNASKLNGPFTGNVTDIRYSDIPKLIGNGWNYKWDPVALAPYLVSDDNSKILTYDDPESIRLKSEYVIKRKLGGVMIWALGYDVTSNGQELINSIRKNYLSVQEFTNDITIDKFSLNTYPNPFNSTCQIEFKLSENKLTTVSVNDIAGREVDLLVHSVLSKGIYQLSWNGSNQISGIYFIRIVAGNHSTTKKVLLLK
jgi:chitinase